MENGSFILKATDQVLPTVEQVGGKGFSLWHLRNEGFPVPAFIILSADYFRMQQGKSISSEMQSKILASVKEDLKGFTEFSVSLSKTRAGSSISEIKGKP